MKNVSKTALTAVQLKLFEKKLQLFAWIGADSTITQAERLICAYHLLHAADGSVPNAVIIDDLSDEILCQLINVDAKVTAEYTASICQRDNKLRRHHEALLQEIKSDNERIAALDEKIKTLNASIKKWKLFTNICKGVAVGSLVIGGVVFLANRD